MPDVDSLLGGNTDASKRFFHKTLTDFVHLG